MNWYSSVATKNEQWGKASLPSAQRYRNCCMATEGTAYLPQGGKHQYGLQRLQLIDPVESVTIKLEVGESSEQKK